MENPGQPRKTNKNLIPHVNGKKLGIVTHTCHLHNYRKLKIGGSPSKSASATNKIPISKQPE
jgi:hypothetical protein